MEKQLAFKRRHLTGAIVGLMVMACITLPLVTIQAQQRRQAATTIEALSVKVKSLEDIQEISNVLIDYGRALDSRDFKAYSALFAKDGSWSGGLGTVSGGPPAIYDFMTSRIGGGRQSNSGDGNATTGRAQGGGVGFGPTYHIMSSFKIDVKGDNATASSRWAFVTAARGPGIQVAGRYEDTFIREDGIWKIKSRQAFNDLAAPTPAPGGTGAQPQSAPTPPAANKR
jgi:SnoaL-like domain